VRKDVTISHRGTRYELGQGPGYHAIWAAGSPDQQPPLQWWHDGPEGRSAAWQRFAELEDPAGIVAVGGHDRAPGGQPWHRGAAVAAVALTAAGIVLGLAGLFPGYLGGASLASGADELVPHLIYLAGWTAGGALAWFGGSRGRIGALLGIGVSVVTFGMFLADLGTAASAGSGGGGTGLALSIAGWVACTAGAAAALRRADVPAPRYEPRQWAVAVTLIVAGAGAAIAFAPSWDRYVLTTATGASQTITAGNAFANPGLVITGDVAVMIAIVIATVMAGLWRPARHGAALLGGATIPLLGQAISALVLAGEGAPPAMFGFSPAEAARLGLQISSGLTLTFWVYCAFVVALLLSCTLLATTTPGAPQPVPPAQPAGTGLSASIGAS